MITEKTFCIFVVDDDPLLRMVMVDQLEGNNYKIHEFGNGEDCLAALDLQPNLILLDIEMPGKNGFEVCREIRAGQFDGVQVLFVSAHDDLEILLAAFNAGGNDFIPKNAKKDLLLRKIETAIAAGKRKQDLKKQLSSAQETAFTAISSLAETGIVLQFLRSSFHCSDLRQLGNLLIETLRQFGVKALIRLTDMSGEFDFGSEKICTPLETSILSSASKLGRISQTNDRWVLNYPHVNMLITTGLDLENKDGIGRLRDYLATLAEASTIRIDAMNFDQQQLQLMESVKELAGLISEIEISQHHMHISMENHIGQLRQEIESALIHSGSADSQAFLIRSIVNNLIGQLSGLFEKDGQLGLRLNEILNKQKSLLQSQ